MFSSLFWVLLASYAFNGSAVNSTPITEINSYEEFNLLASGNNEISIQEFQEVKFLITDLLTEEPKLYFMDSNEFEYHWRFFNEVLGWNLSLIDFNTRTYTEFNRRLLAGSILSRNQSSSQIYTIEFWPGDPIHFKDVFLTFSLLTQNGIFSKSNLFYHPTGETQVSIYMDELEPYTASSIPVISTEELFEGVSYLALNPGKGYGFLRLGQSGSSYSNTDIVVFESIPNDIGHLAGIISTIPQTPLSHINLKAMQNNTPNVFIPGYSESAEFLDMVGKPVKLTVTPTGYLISEIDYSEVLNWLESIRPDSITTLARDFSNTEIISLDRIRLDEVNSYGAKSCNIGELTWCLPAHSVPEGYAIPFYYYNEFMEFNKLYSTIDSLISQDIFNQSIEAREQILGEVRSRIRYGKCPGWMADSLSVMALKFEPYVSLRCRSSTNNEDLPGWSGAGLYNSYTHHPNEGHVSNTVRQVWSSLWTLRAFDEREFYRIDHMSAAMGVLVHPSYKDELANGVAVTRNIFNPFTPGYYINVQLGDDMVTNPSSASVPEEFLVTEQNITGEETLEIQYLNHSNQVSSGQKILSDDQIEQLIDYLERIHLHYAIVSHIRGDSSEFAMEIEFKITHDGDLIVKQARPWVF